MFGMGNNDDEERFWNFIMFKIYATDSEMEEMAPFLGIVILVVVIVVIACVIF